MCGPVGGGTYPRRGRAEITANGITKRSWGGHLCRGDVRHIRSAGFGSVAVGGSFDLSAVNSIYDRFGVQRRIVQDRNAKLDLVGSQRSGILRYFILEEIIPPFGAAARDRSAVAAGAMLGKGHRRAR